MNKLLLLLVLIILISGTESCMSFDKDNSSKLIQYNSSKEEMVEELAKATQYPKELINVSWSTTTNLIGANKSIVLTLRKFDEAVMTDGKIKTIAQQSLPIIKSSVTTIDEYDAVHFLFENSRIENGIEKTVRYQINKDL